MENQTPGGPTNQNELESLEDAGTVVETSQTTDNPAPSTESAASPSPVASAPPTVSSPKPPRNNLMRRVRSRFAFLNIYLLMFILVIVIASGASLVAYNNSKKTTDSATISSQKLDEKTLEALASSDTTVGSSAQVLNVQSSAVFAGKVLVRDSLDVAGALHVGGNLALSSLTVSGNGSFQTFGVSGDGTVQGGLNIQKNLNVSGNASFGGTISAKQLTIGTLQLSGDLNLSQHISAGGSTPSRSGGSALGSGGTTGLSGSDTSGSVTINTGSGPASGCFLTVNFATKFNATPHVLITPVGSAAASLNYYVNRTTRSFSICTASTPAAGTTFGFDYFVLD